MNLVLQPCRPVVLWNDTISKPRLRINSYEAVSNSLPLNSMSSALQQALNHSLTKGRVPLGHFS
ncbi:hypothetical protein DPMN_036097 [Dreissena polymorpha]|uniref:Uncharacterized protein n=1 Tax=Dreissena polymorpha TaxID=45954 RepID=A0A9D4MBY0_DREPO|nr:hypothetical protein DPMN_036097 [Dreissena polymorpha]